MPGFGSGPFGGGAFGEWEWGKRVLFYLAPESPYRLNDIDGLFEAYAEAQALSFDALRSKIRDFGQLRNPLLVRAEGSFSSYLRLGPKITVKGEIEQLGLKASVSGTGAFVTETGRFSFADIGKEILVEKSTIAGNNRAVIVTGVVSKSSVATSPVLSTDAGPLRWTLRSVEPDSASGIEYEIYSGSIVDVPLGYTLTDGYTSLEISKRTVFPTVPATSNLYTEREGTDGYFDGSNLFNSPTANFSQHDVGKLVVLYGSVNPENRGRFEIAAVLSATSVSLTATTTIANDGGPITWAVLRRSRLTLSGTSVLRGVVEQYGSSMSLTAPDTLVDLAADFTSADVGKLITIRATGSANNGTYEILTVVSRSAVTVDATFGVDASTFVWEVRSTTLVGDGTQVEIRAHSLLSLLAKDFGIDVDSRESEEFQRRWVASVSRWMPLKGSADGYAFLGALTGFTVTATELFRISQTVYDLLSTTATLIVGEEGAGRSGTDGYLFDSGGRVRFSSATGVFTYKDVGLQIEVSGSGSGNDGLRTIETVVNATTVEFRLVDVATTPEGPGLTWRIVRLYGKLPPSIPVLDEINTDLMTALKGPSVFSVDAYCFETGWSTTIGAGDGVFVITAVSPGSPSPVPIAYTVTAYGDVNVVAGIGVGSWRATDSLGAEYFLEDVPTQGLEVGAGRAGADGQLTAPDLFVSATAVFTAADVGRQVYVSGSGSGNDGLHRIEAYVGPTTVQLSEAPLLPEANTGSLMWAVVYWTFPVLATQPPATGAGTLDYVCSSQLSCDYCKSNRVLIKANTSLDMTDPKTRLLDRLEHVRPQHVELILDYGVTTTATVTFTATVTTP